MNNDTPADAMAKHFPSGLRQKRYEIATAGDVVDGPVCVDCHCGASFSATDEQEARQLWAYHASAATSLAAQDDWTTKRVAELVAEGDGHWRSCTGCHETNEGAETGDYPFNPVFKTYQGGGCGECGGIGVVWDDIDYADYAEFCLKADDPAPSLAAQDKCYGCDLPEAECLCDMAGANPHDPAHSLAALAAIEVNSS